MHWGVKSMRQKIALLFFALLLLSCDKKSIESEFFDWENFSYEKMEDYPLDQQFKIFLYGNQEVRPSLTGLAAPIAKRGEIALDYVLDQVRDSENDLDFRDSMVIFREMENGGYYGVCEDEIAIQEITANADKISHPDWRAIYNQMLENLC